MPERDLLVSVVIPVLNDTPQLAGALTSIGHDPRVEVVVVDGGNGEARATLEDVAPHVRWLRSAPGRWRQMNEGAGASCGQWLLFLHADTRLPSGWIEEVERAAQNPACVGGSFRLQLDSQSRWARLIERGVATRVRWFDLPYGDQALFVRRDVFSSLGGYEDLPLMEDVAFVRRLARAGRLCHSPLQAVTSARKWELDGWIVRSLENVCLVLLFLAGVSPRRLAARYRR